MRLARFDLHRPTSLRQALELKARYGDAAAFHAGGTELLIALKAHVLQYDHLIDIKRLPELHGIEAHADGGLVIGALSSHNAIANHPLVCEYLPAYAELSDNVANIRVRVAGTIGGNLCFAEPHADPPALLCALDARYLLAGPNGERELPAREFNLAEFTTARADDELLVSIRVPARPAHNRAAYRSFGHTERPAVGVAVSCMPGSRQPWSFWTGAICGVPTRLAQAEEAANALPVDTPPAELRERLAAALARDAEGLQAQDDLHGGADYKKHLVTVLAQRALEACLT